MKRRHQSTIIREGGVRATRQKGLANWKCVLLQNDKTNVKALCAIGCSAIVNDVSDSFQTALDAVSEDAARSTDTCRVLKYPTASSHHLG